MAERQGPRALPDSGKFGGREPMAAIGGINSDSPFDRLHMAIAGSKPYRDAIRQSSPGLPEWLTPASVINIGDLQSFADEVKVVADQTIVDLGCGGGGPSLWVAEETGASLIGVDASNAAVTIAAALAKSRGMTYRAHFVLGQIEATSRQLSRSLARFLQRDRQAERRTVR